MTTRRIRLGPATDLYLTVPYSGPRAWLLLVLGAVRAQAMYRKYDALRNVGFPSRFWCWVFRMSDRAVVAVAPKEGTL